MNSPSSSKVTQTTAAAPPAPAPVSSSPPQVRESGAQSGPGRLIVAAREKAGLSVESLAAQIRLSRGTLEALERDDFGTLNEPVYVKGYYRKCAKVLGLADSDLIAAYERVVGPKQPQAPTKLLLAADRGLSKRGGVAGSGGLRWLWVVIVAALIGGVAYLLTTKPETLSLSKSQTSGDTYSQTGLATVPATAAASSSATPVPAAASPQPSIAQSAPTTPPATVTPAAQQPAASAPATPAPSRVTAAQPTTPAPVALAPSTALSSTTPSTMPAAGPDELQLSFHGTSWVRIEDASGKVLLSGVIQAGDHQAVRGKPPYSLFLGNAPGVMIEYGGKPFDSAPFTNPASSTARFSIPK